MSWGLCVLQLFAMLATRLGVICVRLRLSTAVVARSYRLLNCVRPGTRTTVRLPPCPLSVQALNTRQPILLSSTQTQTPHHTTPPTRSASASMATTSRSTSPPLSLEAVEEEGGELSASESDDCCCFCCFPFCFLACTGGNRWRWVVIVVALLIGGQRESG